MNEKTRWGRAILALLAIMPVLAGCGQQAQKQETITVSGAFALYPMMVMWAEEYQTANPDVRIDVSAGGAGKGYGGCPVRGGEYRHGVTGHQTGRRDPGGVRHRRDKGCSLPGSECREPGPGRYLAKGISREIFEKIYITGEITTWEK